MKLVVEKMNRQGNKAECSRQAGRNQKFLIMKNIYTHYYCQCENTTQYTTKPSLLFEYRGYGREEYSDCCIRLGNNTDWINRIT